MADFHPAFRVTATGPALDLYEIEPDDDAALPKPASMIRCKGDAGDITFMTAAGSVVTYPLDAGEDLEVIAVKVFQTGTTATGLWAHCVA